MVERCALFVIIALGESLLVSGATFAQAAWTSPTVAAFVVTFVGAVADELVLAHPDHATGAGISAMIGGPALYLAGVAAFKWACSDRPRPPLSHLAGLVLLAALAVPALGHWLSALAIAGLACAALVAVTVWEHLSLRAVAPSRTA